MEKEGEEEKGKKERRERGNEGRDYLKRRPMENSRYSARKG